MALVKAENIGNQIEGMNSLPLFRQIGMMIALAATVALAVAIVLWVKEPSYHMLYGNLSDQEMLEITSTLDQAGIRYDINSSTNAVLVDAGKVHDARMRLAGLGLPKGSGTGYELLEKDQGSVPASLLKLPGIIARLKASWREQFLHSIIFRVPEFIWPFQNNQPLYVIERREVPR